MLHLEFRIIPGYLDYAVTQNGIIKYLPKNKVVKQYLLNGYFIIDSLHNSLTQTLPVHRAVALTWVENNNPLTKNMVNHIDGNKQNNWYTNLEWVTCSENNYHAINSGLRSDNIECYVRDFETREIHAFSSINQASFFMGFNGCAHHHDLCPKKFGSLIKDRYEFRYKEDTTPWFYEGRLSKIIPSRYWIRILDRKRNSREIFSYAQRILLKDYQLYDSPYGKSIPNLIKWTNEKYSHISFILRDSYFEDKFRTYSTSKRIPPIKVTARRDGEVLEFSSLKSTARYFGVDRKSITRRLNADIDLDRWFFITNGQSVSNN